MQKLPVFNPGPKEKEWVTQERRTAKLIQALWEAASGKTRRDPGFLKVLIRCSWVNGESHMLAAGRKWRNGLLAAWLDLPPGWTDQDLSRALERRLRLRYEQAEWIVATPSGITNYYKSLRPGFLEQLDRHADAISKAFTMVSMKSPDLETKIANVANMVLALPDFTTPRGGTTSMMNGLAPALACLDPQRRFPIMNARTRDLLKIIHRELDAQGAVSLSKLIGTRGIKDAFELDVYAWSQPKTFAKAPRANKSVYVPDPRTVGLKAEEEAVANLARRKVVIRRRHNELVNRFLRAVEWKLLPKESEYDLLIENWQPGRWLLIEAKTETSGVSGRTQIRQAIGQLFDYRWRSFRDRLDTVDLALLTPTKPDQDILDLLASIDIEAYWFEGRRLAGTTPLI